MLESELSRTHIKYFWNAHGSTNSHVIANAYTVAYGMAYWHIEFTACAVVITLPTDKYISYSEHVSLIGSTNMIYIHILSLEMQQLVDSFVSWLKEN